MNPQIEKFLKELLRDANQTGLGEALESQMIQELYGRLEDRLIATAMNHLTNQQQDELEKMASDKKNLDKVEAFFRKNIANYDEIFAQALLDFRNLYIEGGKMAE